MKTENSRRVAKSRPVCMGLNISIFVYKQKQFLYTALFADSDIAQFRPADAKMALPTRQMHTNLVLRQKHFSSISNEISPEGSLKMENKRHNLDPSNNNRSGM